MALSLHSPGTWDWKAGPQETPAQDPTGAAAVLGKAPHKLTVGVLSLSL